MYLACLKSRASFHSMFGNVTSQRPAVPHQSFRSKTVIVYDRLTEEINKLEGTTPTLKWKLIAGEHREDGWINLTELAKKKSRILIS